jgi:hypothetical protein
MDKPKCSACNERDVFSKGMCSGCYGKEWRRQRKAERDAKIAAEFPPKQLTAGEDVIEGEIVHDEPRSSSIPETHLVATNPVEMQAARSDLKAWLESRLTVLERDIIEANAALNEARKNGWATNAWTSARNRAVDEETFYNKILVAVEAGYTMIPDFPIEVFAVRRGEEVKFESQTYQGIVNGPNTHLGQPVPPDHAPAGAGDYRNPLPATHDTTRENKLATPENKQPRYYTTITRATAKAMKEKTFDQIGVCLPTTAVAGGRQVQRGARAGDPLIIGQIVGKRVGSRQKVVSFIIAWHLNLNEL